MTDIYSEYQKRIAEEVAAIEDRVITKLLTKYKLEGVELMSELEEKGILLFHTIDQEGVKTVTLCKIIDKIQYKITPKLSAMKMEEL